MKTILLAAITLTSFSAFTSTTLNFSVKGKDSDQKELFNENLGLRRGQIKKIVVNDWIGRANSQTLTYEVRAGISPVNSHDIRANIRAIVIDSSGSTPVTLFNEEKLIDFTFGPAKSINFESQQNGTMLNQSIEFKAL